MNNRTPIRLLILSVLLAAVAFAGGRLSAPSVDDYALQFHIEHQARIAAEAAAND